MGNIGLSDRAGTLVKTPVKMLRKPVLITVLVLMVFAYLLLVPSLSYAGVKWTSNGVPVCNESFGQVHPRITADGQGNTIVAWLDQRSGIGTPWVIYAQKLNSDGVPQWGAGGVSVMEGCGDDEDGTKYEITADGSGGAIVVWDWRNGTARIIYAQKINASGERQWISTGAVVTDATGGQLKPCLVSDGLGGAIFAWEDSRSGNSDVYVQRLDAAGSRQWRHPPGWGGFDVPVCEDPGTQWYTKITTDGSGGAIVAWDDVEAGGVGAGRIGSSGIVQWTAGISAAGTRPQIASDDSGGAIIVSGREGEVYTKRIDGTGGTVWGDGTPVPGTAVNCRVSEDGSNGAVIAWQDDFGAEKDVYAKRYDSDGNSLWSAEVCDVDSWQFDHQLVCDTHGGATVTWWDHRSDTGDIYAQNISPTGTVRWGTGGMAVCTMSGTQRDPVATTDENGGAVIAWTDNRSGNDDIYAQRAGNDPPTVTSISPSVGINDGVVLIDNLAGSYFMEGAEAYLKKAGETDIKATSLSVVSSSKITCQFDITGADVGSWDVYVENNDGQGDSLENGLTVEYPAPTLSGITPNLGDNDGVVGINDLSGTNFRDGVVVKLKKSGQGDITATNVQFVFSKKITCDFDLNGKEVGSWDIYVENDDGKNDTLENGFTIEYPAPVVNGIVPNSALNDGVVSVTDLQGTSFRDGAIVTLKRSGEADIPGTGVFVESPTKITCQFDLDHALPGNWDVHVENDDDKSDTMDNGFTVENAPPVISGVAPNNYVTNAKVHVTDLSGDFFMAGAEVRLKRTGQSDIVATNVTVVSSTRITCDLDLAGAEIGTWDVFVQNTDGKSYALVNGFEVVYHESEWTVMVYMDGDNNLEGAGIDDFLEIAAAAEDYLLPNDVNVLVQFDRVDGHDDRYDNWTETKRFEVFSGSTPVDTDAGFISNLGELNMGDPSTLESFTQWAMDFRPAQRYMVVLWNHGDGIKCLLSQELTYQGVCVDDTSNGDEISLSELRNALKSITSNGLNKIDIIGFDACLMGMAEVDYQVYPYCEVRVSSEESEPGNGWPYNTIIADLVATPTMTDNQLGTTIVDRYSQSYGNDYTQSAVDFSAGYDNLVSAVDALGGYLRGHLEDEYFNIWNAVGGSQHFYYWEYIDLYDFASRLESLTSDMMLKGRAQTVMDRVNDVVIHESHGAEWPGAHGISIYYALGSQFYLNAYDGSAGQLDFTADTCWDELQREYLQGNASNVAAVANGGQVVDFSEEYGGAWVADNLIDSGLSGWSSYTTIAGNYITVELAGGVSRPIGTIYVDPGPSNSPTDIDPPQTTLKEFHIDISNDGSSFHTVHSGSFALSEMNQIKEIDISSQNESAKYVKIVVDSCQDPGPGWVDIAELQVYSATKPTISKISPGTGRVGTEVTIEGNNFGEMRSSSKVTFNGIQAGQYTSWSNGKIKCKVPVGASTGLVKVETFAGRSNGVQFTVKGPIYFAEGTCRPGFDPYLCIQNPGAEDAEVKITYMKGDGTTDEETLTVKASSRFTVVVKDRLGEGDDIAHDFSAKVESVNGQEIVVERSIYFNYKGVWSGGHAVTGIQNPSSVFYFAEGTCRPGFDPYICIQNPNDTEAQVKITYMKGDGTTDEENLGVAANSRSTVVVKNRLGEGDDPNHDFSAQVECTNGLGIICERPVYFNYRGKWTGGHSVAGTTAPAKAFYLAEGTTRSNDSDGSYEEWICIQNPGGEVAEVKVTYMLGTGENIVKEYKVERTSRITVDVNLDVGADQDVSTVIESSQPVIIERPLYFDYQNKWTGGHIVAGVPSPGTEFFFAEGTTRQNGTDGYFDEWVCLGNPNDEDAELLITYFTAQSGTQVQEVTVPARSRRTVDVRLTLGVDVDNSIKVESRNGVPVLAERSMYFDYKSWCRGGHAVSGCLPE